MLTSLEVEFLGEIVNCLFEAHTKKKPSELYKPAVESFLHMVLLDMELVIEYILCFGYPRRLLEMPCEIQRLFSTASMFLSTGLYLNQPLRRACVSYTG